MNDNVKILITGDFCPRNRIVKLVEQSNVKAIFNDLLPIIQQADYAVVNLEAPINSAQTLAKNGPRLHCNQEALQALKSAGFQLVTLANNHFLDCGCEGARNTIESCNRVGLEYVGAGANSNEADVIFYKIFHGIRVAFLNFCEHEFSIASKVTAGSNPIDPVLNYYRIKEARESADHVIVIVHGGIEEYQYPTPRMQQTYRFFADAGADVIVNHHQHCYSGYEKYNNAFIFYGLGNFSFDWETPKPHLWHEGFALELTLSKKGLAFQMHPYFQAEVNFPGIRLIPEEEKMQFEKHITELNKIILNESALDDMLDQHVLKVSSSMMSVFTPYSNRYMKALHRRKLLPSFLGQKKLLQIRNIIECESHNDIIKRVLKRILEKQ